MEGARLSFFHLVPVLVAAVVFKLAISDGGRDPQSLALAQVVTFAALAVLVWTGRARIGTIGRALLLIVGAVAITSITSVQSEASVREGLQWTMYLSIVVVTASTLSSMAAGRRFLDAMAAVAGWLCLIALFMFWGAGNPAMRWYSTFYWPNPFAGFLMLVLPVEAVRLAHADAWRDRLAHGSLTVLLAVSFVLTYSRGAWLSLLVVLPVMSLLLRPGHRRGAVASLLVVTVLVFGAVVLLTRGTAAVPTGQTVAGRVASIADAGDVSVQGRVNFWKAGLAIFRDHAIAGIGPGTFGVVHARYQRDVRFYARDPHSLYIQTLAEMGLVGSVALAVLLMTFVSVWVRTVRRFRDHEGYPVVCGAGLGVLAFLVHSGIELNWAYPANPAMMCALAGVLVWADRTHAPSGGTGAHPRAAGTRIAISLLLVVPIVITILFQRAHNEFVAGIRESQDDRPAAALAHYRAAQRLNPLSARYRSRVAVVAAHLGRPDDAETALRQAIVLDPMNASHRIELAMLLMASGKPRRLVEAEALLSRAIELDPVNRPEVFRALAGVYQRQGRPDASARIYRQAIGRYLGLGLSGTMPHLLLWPEVVQLALDGSEFFVRQGNVIEAERLLRVVLAEDPESPVLLAALDKIR